MIEIVLDLGIMYYFRLRFNFYFITIKTTFYITYTRCNLCESFSTISLMNINIIINRIFVSRDIYICHAFDFVNS